MCMKPYQDFYRLGMYISVSGRVESLVQRLTGLSVAPLLHPGSSLGSLCLISLPIAVFPQAFENASMFEQTGFGSV